MARKRREVFIPEIGVARNDLFIDAIVLLIILLTQMLLT